MLFCVILLSEVYPWQGAEGSSWLGWMVGRSTSYQNDWATHRSNLIEIEIILILISNTAYYLPGCWVFCLFFFHRGTWGPTSKPCANPSSSTCSGSIISQLGESNACISKVLCKPCGVGQIGRGEWESCISQEPGICSGKACGRCTLPPCDRTCPNTEGYHVSPLPQPYQIWQRPRDC